jgi:hypothetical protein
MAHPGSSRQLSGGGGSTSHHRSASATRPHLLTHVITPSTLIAINRKWHWMDVNMANAALTKVIANE